MRRFYLFGFLLLTCFDTLGQVGFKLAAIRSAPATFDADWIGRIIWEQWIYLSVAGYIGAFFTWMTLLRHAPIGPAFAASHSEILPVLLISSLFLGEHLSGRQLFGGLLIIAGIGLLALQQEKG